MTLSAKKRNFGGQATIVAAFLVLCLGLWSAPVAAETAISARDQASATIRLVIPARASLDATGGAGGVHRAGRWRLDLCAPAQSLILKIGNLARTLRPVRRAGCASGTVAVPPAAARRLAASSGAAAILVVRPE